MASRVCPDCGEEFRPEIVTCSDCGALLVDDYEDSEGGRKDLLPEKEEPLELAALYHSNRISDVTPLAERLRERGLPMCLATSEESFVLLVAAGDLERARGHVADLLGSHDAAPSFDGEIGACPACGERMAEGAAECPSCGLAFGGGEG